jgi:hypothetical protein
MGMITILIHGLDQDHTRIILITHITHIILTITIHGHAHILTTLGMAVMVGTKNRLPDKNRSFERFLCLN